MAIIEVLSNAVVQTKSARLRVSFVLNDDDLTGELRVQKINSVKRGTYHKNGFIKKPQAITLFFDFGVGASDGSFSSGALTIAGTLFARCMYSKLGKAVRDAIASCIGEDEASFKKCISTKLPHLKKEIFKALWDCSIALGK